jgi:hypothetical protein
MMQKKIVIALAAAATVFAASILPAAARHGGGGGGFGGGGGMRASGFSGGGMRTSGFVGGGIRTGSLSGINRGFVSSGFVRSGNIARFSGVRTGALYGNRIAPLHHRPFVRNRFFVGGFYPYGYGYGYNTCLRQVPTAIGWTWVNVCAYPDYYY